MEKEQIFEGLNKAYFSEQMDERSVIEHLPELLASAKLFIDIGASLGQYAYFANNVMLGGEIIAIEADPIRFEQLKHNCQKWESESAGRNKLTPVHAAASNQSETITFYTTHSNVSGGLFPHKLRGAGRDAAGNPVRYDKITVNSITLDTFLGGRVPDVVKVDVEGGELRVLKGATRLLTAGKTKFLVEIHGWQDPHGQRTPQDVHEFMVKFDFLGSDFHGHTLFEKRGYTMTEITSKADPIRIGIVGCGAVTQRFHLPSTRRVDGCSVTVLVDSDRSRAEQLAAKYRVPNISTDFRDLPKHADAAIVAVPHRLHAAIGEHLLSAGCHVLMEKPLAVTDAECHRLITLAKEKGLVLTVGHMRRYFRAYQIAKKLIEAGTLGKIKSFDVREGGVYNWPVVSDFMFRAEEAGGGVLADNGVHTLDFVLWCLGDAESVEYYDDNLGGVEAECTMHLHMKGGARGVVELSRLRNLRNTAIISGERGEIELHLRTDEIAFHPGSEQSYQSFEALPPLTHAMPRKLADCFQVQLESWLGTISGETPNFVPGEEAGKSAALIEACYQQRRPIDPIIGMHRETERSHPTPLLKDKVVLVTGATGSIGGRLVERLVIDHQAQVRVLVRNLANLSRVSRLPVAIYQGDVTDSAAVDRAVAGCDVVFHCAYAFGGSPAEQQRIAVEGSRNIAQAVLRHKVRSLVYVSSISVYEPLHDGSLDETAPKRPSGWTYPDIKKRTERMMLEFHNQHGLPVVVVQPSIVYGPFVKSWTQSPLTQLKSGTVILPNEGSGLCNAVYIDDVADALILAGTNPNAIGETFLISGPEPVTWREFYRAYEDMVGITATKYMSALEIQARHNKRNDYLRRSITGTLRWLITRSPYPVVSAGKWLKERSPFVARTLQQYGVTGPRSLDGPRDIVPDPQRLALFQSKAHVRIDKAREILGYEPRFDMESGMHLTKVYVQWANPDDQVS